MPPQKKTLKQKKSKQAPPKSKVAQKSTKPTSKSKKVLVEIPKKGDEFIKFFDKLVNSGQFPEARAAVDALKLKRWQRLNLLSVIEFKMGNLFKAEEMMKQALRESDVKEAVYVNLAALLVTQGRMAEGLTYAARGYKAQPTQVKAIHLYLNCLLDLGKSDLVLTICEDALKHHPDDKTILVSKASALRSESKPDEALILLDELIEKFPEEPVIRRIKADLLGDTNSTEALKFYDEAIKMSTTLRGTPDPAVQWNMSLHLLRNRDFVNGWECWEQGFHPIVGTMGRNLPARIKAMDRADADGKEIDPDKWTIVCAEQGIGDQILFSHVMNEAIDEFKKILYITEKRMYPIIKRSFPKIEVGCSGLTYDWERTSLKKNGYIPLGSLPRRYRKKTEDYTSKKTPFLLANKPLYDKYKEYLTKLANGRPIIGISWKGGFWAIQRKTKELAIQNWEPIFKKDALFVNLQYGDIRNEAEYLKSNGYNMTIFNKLNYKEHLDDWLAIAGACHGIISVSTALVHFAGAIGQKVAVVMPSHQGPWHLGMKDTESIAYKNVNIFRPDKNESTHDLITRVANLIIT
ncbi:hypothetical protein N9V13_05785 [Betaproteobacteria bacterium]|nr:hypothetical protein [Betaproteobacteria bacterium]